MPPKMNTKKKRAAADPVERPAKRSKTPSAPPPTRPSKKPPSRAARAAARIVHNTAPSAKYRVFVFGDGTAGELGLGSVKGATEVKAPKPNPNLQGVVGLAAGGMHAAALTSDGKVLTWGVNDQKALGRDTAWDGGERDIDDDKDSDDESDPGQDLNPLESNPTAVPSGKFPAGTTIVQISAGDSSTFALTEDGLVYGWGTFRDNNGVFGFTFDKAEKALIVEQKEPILIPDLTNVTSIATGADFALALDMDGRVYSWGTGQQGELGRRLPARGHIQGEVLLPALVSLPARKKIKSIHAGLNHALAVEVNGDVYAWGLNNFGQTGIAKGAGSEQAVIEYPQISPSLSGKGIKMIAGGGHHSVGLTDEGHCLVWGRVDGGQLGIDSTTLPTSDASKVVVDDRGRPRILLQPTALPLPPCAHVASGTDHSFALTDDGKSFSWGFNVNGQCGQGTEDDILVAKQMNGKFIRDEKLIWGGAGGQYSMLAALM